MSLERIFPKETIVVPVESSEKDELLEELVEKIVQKMKNQRSDFSEIDRAEVISALLEREKAMSTGIMESVAVPHALVSSIKAGSIGAIGISREGIDWDSLDGRPVRVVFLILGAKDETESHIQVLKSLATVLQVSGFIEKLCSLSSPSDVFDALRLAEETGTV